MPGSSCLCARHGFLFDPVTYIVFDGIAQGKVAEV
jgi:hypothetical protein